MLLQENVIHAQQIYQWQHVPCAVCQIYCAQGSKSRNQDISIGNANYQDMKSEAVYPLPVQGHLYWLDAFCLHCQDLLELCAYQLDWTEENEPLEFQLSPFKYINYEDATYNKQLKNSM